jgi:membrane protease YdiL (CAAX protease family)
VPLLERIFGQDEEKINLKSWFLWSAGTGVALGVVIITGDYIFYKLGSPLSLFETELPAWWTGLLAAFSAGIGEELLMRFLLMTLLTLLFLKLFRMPRTAAVWSAIILVALVFGALHLPATAELVELTSLIIVRAMLLNGIAGIAFGLLYWKQGLESAMVAHILTDVIVHGLMPLFV